MRKLLFVRHADAEDPEIALREGRSEFQRTLTPTGIELFGRASHELKAIHDRLDFIFHSPLVRARQTAELLHSAYPDAELLAAEALAPGSRLDNISELLGGRDNSNVALVGHEPDFGHAISAALGMNTPENLKVKKGSFMLVTFEAEIASGRGVLQWSVTSEMLVG